MDYLKNDDGSITKISTGSRIYPGSWMWTEWELAGQPLIPSPPSEFHDLVDGQWELNKDRKAVEIRARYAAQMRMVIAPYSDEESRTFDIQAAEAEAYLADQDVSPAKIITISRMAARRGISIRLMAEKIMENTPKFKAALGDILGAQQKELDELYSEPKES